MINEKNHLIVHMHNNSESSCISEPRLDILAPETKEKYASFSNKIFLLQHVKYNKK